MERPKPGAEESSNVIQIDRPLRERQRPVAPTTPEPKAAYIQSKGERSYVTAEAHGLETVLLTGRRTTALRRSVRALSDAVAVGHPLAEAVPFSCSFQPESTKF